MAAYGMHSDMNRFHFLGSLGTVSCDAIRPALMGHTMASNQTINPIKSDVVLDLTVVQPLRVLLSLQ